MTNDGKFVLDGKRVRFSDYGGSSKETSMSDYDKEVLTASALLSRLNNIEGDLGHIEADVNDLGDLWCDSNTSINNRLDAIEKRLDSIMHGDDVRNHRYYKLEEDYNRQLSKCAVTQATIKAIEEKLNGIY